MARLTSRLSADERLQRYDTAASSEEPNGFYDEGAVSYRPPRLSPAQRRRAVHKAQGQEHEDLANPDRWQQMGAKRAYLSPQQFMLMSDVKRLPSVDMSGGPASQLIRLKQKQVAAGEGDTADYPALREAMRKGGPAGQAVPPVHIANGENIFHQYGSPWGLSLDEDQLALGNGGHRLAIANELGWKAIPYTRHASSSGYGDDRGFNKDFDGDEESDYGYRGGSSTSDYQASAKQTTTGDIADIGREPSSLRYQRGERSYVPGFTGQAMPGNRWHARGKDGVRTRGLYTELHPKQTPIEAPLSLNEQQFARTRMGEEPFTREVNAIRNARKYQQDVIPGLNHYGSQYGDHEWSAGNASEPNWPGGGKIQHGDMFQSW